MTTNKASAAVGVLLLVASSAHATTLSGLNPVSGSYLISLESPKDIGVAPPGDMFDETFTLAGYEFGNAETWRVEEYLYDFDDGTDALGGPSMKLPNEAEAFVATAFIQSMTGNAPEPKTMFLVGVALIALSLMGPKRRHR